MFYHFTIKAEGIDDIDEWCSRLYACGAMDALCFIDPTHTTISVFFDRKAPSLPEAVSSACASLKRAGATIINIQPPKG